MSIITLLAGSLVGFSLGLTGGGGAIFAVPLLVYLIGVPAREAVGISLLTVGITSLIGFLYRTKQGKVEFVTGIVFALAGISGAPIGSAIADRIPEGILITLFAILMIAIAFRMAWKTKPATANLPILHDHEDDRGPTCKRDPEGKLRMTSPCAMLLGVVGLGAGILTGMFGVGGGFIIVPALVAFAGMGMQRAVGTSLLVITLVSISGVISQVMGGRSLSIETASFFSIGSLLGLFAGTALATKLAGPTLQRIFAAAILFVACFVLYQSLS
jgi:uncharacterized membrane protein YfcA